MHASSLSQIDKNFELKSELDEKDLIFLSAKQEPFKIHGLYNSLTEPLFLRLPQSVAENVNEGVAVLNYHTAGGRIRFSTDSRYVAIKCKTQNNGLMPHMPLLGSSGFDLYIDDIGTSVYYKSFIPPIDFKDGFESIIYFDNKEMRNITINFPLYNNVDSLHIGIQEDSTIDRGMGYWYVKPVVYYGSSITQGACASRPGNTYQAIISRWLDCDHINLGFSGSAMGEDSIAKYIANLDMSAFVLDYDHNAPSVEHLEQTHEAFFKTIREKNKRLPIIIISKPDFDSSPVESKARRDIIYNTYRNAVDSGDTKVFYIDGETLFQTANRDSCTVDGCHPNDLGFMRMAEVLGPFVKKAIE